MSVVQRCPNCGTTQAVAGECEACHEARVRYFCTNHDPGVWLDGPTCPQCAARAAPAARPTVPASAPPSRARPAALGVDAGASGDAGARPRSVDEVAPSRQALWEKLLRGVVLARRAERELPSRSPASGWLMQLVRRLVIIAVVLAVALGVTIYLVARSLH